VGIEVPRLQNQNVEISLNESTLLRTKGEIHPNLVAELDWIEVIRLSEEATVS
jgi:hypothetical protein